MIYTKVIVLNTKTLKISAAKDNSSEIGVNGLKETFCGCKM
jgi:hypothetical protein